MAPYQFKFSRSRVNFETLLRTLDSIHNFHSTHFATWLGWSFVVCLRLFQMDWERYAACFGVAFPHQRNNQASLFCLILLTFKLKGKFHNACTERCAASYSVVFPHLRNDQASFNAFNIKIKRQVLKCDSEKQIDTWQLVWMTCCKIKFCHINQVFFRDL